MSQTEINPDARLGRKQTAEALSAFGYRIAEATLASMASRGGGPLFSKFGPRVVYRWGDVLQWAERRLSNPVASTSELAPRAPGTAKRVPDSPCVVLDHNKASLIGATASDKKSPGSG